MTFAEPIPGALDRRHLVDRHRESGTRPIEILNGARRSASVASHFATDIGERHKLRAADLSFRILAMIDSLPTITADSNDVRYEYVSVQQPKNLAEPENAANRDQGSGNSPNVLRAIEDAKGMGSRTIAFSDRDGSKLGPRGGALIYTSPIRTREASKMPIKSCCT
jgi:phosphoheptose isomerase